MHPQLIQQRLNESHLLLLRPNRVRTVEEQFRVVLLRCAFRVMAKPSETVKGEGSVSRITDPLWITLRHAALFDSGADAKGQGAAEGASLP